MYRPSSRWTWAFVIISLVQALVVLGFESYIFGKFQSAIIDDKRPHAKSVQFAIPTFLALYIFGFIYQLVLVYDALRLKNTIQVIGLCMFNVALMIYALVQQDQIKSTGPEFNEVYRLMRPYLVAIPCILGVGTVLMTFVARKLYDEFAWTIYKHISADLKMKRRYLTFQIYITLLKFDFFLFLGFTVQFIVIISSDHRDAEFWLTIAAVPVTILILIMAGVFCRRESRAGMALIIMLYFCALAYFIFKLFRIYEKPHYYELYKPARKPLTTFAVITIILIICTIVNAILCTLNFGRGLKPHIVARKVNAPSEEKWDQNQSFALPPRMEYGGGAGPGAGEYGQGASVPLQGGYIVPPKGSRMTID